MGMLADERPGAQPLPGWRARNDRPAAAPGRRGWPSWIDALVPPGIVALGGDVLRRGRLTTAACLLGASTLLASGLYTAIVGLSSGVSVENLIFGFLFLVLPLALRRSHSIVVFANTAVGLGLCNLLVLWVGSAGTNLGALFAFPTVPLCGMLLAGRRSGITFTILSVLAIFLPAVFPGVPPGFGELEIPSGQLALSMLRDAVLITVGVGLFAALYDMVRGAAVHDANEERLRAEESRRRAVVSSQHLATLLDVSRRLQSRRPDFEEEVRRAVATASSIAGTDAAIFTFWDLQEGRVLGRYVHPPHGLFPTVVPLSQAAGWMESCLWSRRQLERGQVIAVPRIDDLPAEAEAERALFGGFGIRAWLTVPIPASQVGATGFLTVACRSERESWSAEDVTTVRLLSEIITSVLNQSRAEAALRESEEKFSRAFAALPDGLVLVDSADMKILECNEAFAALAGAGTRQEILGQPLASLSLEFLGEDCARLAEILQGPSPNRTVEVTTGAGSPMERQLVVVATHIEVDGRLWALVLVRDVTEQRHLEIQLRQSQKMEAVGRLAGGVAHDFNNMLTVITGWAEALRDELHGPQREAIDQIRASAQRSADLTRRLLAFSRRQMLQPRVVELNELLQGAESLLRRLIGEHIQLMLDLAPDTGCIRVDPVRLEQAVVNLAINARDAMPRGGALHLRTRSVPRNAAWARPRGLAMGDFAVLEVIDEGCGMDEETAARVLEPFFTTKEEGEGTGLGLSMADGVVRQSGGLLELRSAPGRGTTVEINLPRVAPAPSETAARLQETNRTPSGSRRTVLLAEDEELVRRLARRVLEDAGHQVLEATNGLEALAVARTHDGPIDLLLTDLVMPRMSGIELAKRLGALRPDLRVVFMSGYLRGEGGEALPEDAEILAKPFTPTELCEFLQRVITA